VTPRRGPKLLLAGGPTATLLLALCLLFNAAPGARADDRIWSAIVLASESEKPKPPPAELQRLAPKIERFFGYKQLELIGSATKEIDEEFERWLVPSQHFWLCVKSKRVPGADRTYLLNISLVHDRRPLVETQAKLAPDAPLFIRGPMHARGQIIIVLQVQK